MPDRTPIASPVAEDSLVIGLVGTLSGRDAWRGDDAFEGADVAVQFLNRSVDGDESSFELVTRDDGGDPAVASQLVQGLAADDRTVGIVYAGPTQGLAPAEVALADAGIPAVAVYGDLYGARLLQPHLFQVSPPHAWQARRLARYLLVDRDYEVIGGLFSASLDGKTSASALAAAVRDQGGRLVAAEYSEGGGGLPAAIDRLRRGGAEAVVVQGQPAVFQDVVVKLRLAKSLYRTTAQARLASARDNTRRARLRAGWWHPQLAAFDLAIHPSDAEIPEGTVASDTYARGAHYLPIPSFESFNRAFADWWDAAPLGFERRAFEAARLIGWAALREGDEDRAVRLESLRGDRFGGLDVTFGPDDHTSVGETTVGLWVVPREGISLQDRIPSELPWVPLARGFTINGRRTTVLAQDWAHLFRDPPPEDAPAPFVRTARYGVTTSQKDQVH